MNRVTTLVGASVVIGGLSGLATSTTLGPALPLGLVAGLATGAAIAPVAVFTIRQKRLRTALALVGVPTVAVATVSGFLSLPPLAWLFAVLTFAIQCIVAKSLLVDEITPGRCPACGYDLLGLALTRCPECGTDASLRVPTRRRTYAAIVQVLALLLIVIPLGILVDRRRTPADTASLVERLGDNDMELSNKAQHELMRRDPGALVGALSNPNPSIRGKAVQALGWLADPSTIGKVRALEKDPDPWVRRCAESAAAQITGGK
jgi:hypothetical protein